MPETVVWQFAFGNNRFTCIIREREGKKYFYRETKPLATSNLHHKDKGNQSIYESLR